jgi:hypothetical protein
MSGKKAPHTLHTPRRPTSAAGGDPRKDLPPTASSSAPRIGGRVAPSQPIIADHSLGIQAAATLKAHKPGSPDIYPKTPSAQTPHDFLTPSSTGPIELTPGSATKPEQIECPEEYSYSGTNLGNLKFHPLSTIYLADIYDSDGKVIHTYSSKKSELGSGTYRSNSNGKKFTKCHRFFVGPSDPRNITRSYNFDIRDFLKEKIMEGEYFDGKERWRVSASSLDVYKRSHSTQDFLSTELKISYFCLVEIPVVDHDEDFLIKFLHDTSNKLAGKSLPALVPTVLGLNNLRGAEALRDAEALRGGESARSTDATGTAASTPKPAALYLGPTRPASRGGRGTSPRAGARIGGIAMPLPATISPEAGKTTQDHPAPKPKTKEFPWKNFSVSKDWMMSLTVEPSTRGDEDYSFLFADEEQAADFAAFIAHKMRAYAVTNAEKSAFGSPLGFGHLSEISEPPFSIEGRVGGGGKIAVKVAKDSEFMKRFIKDYFNKPKDGALNAAAGGAGEAAKCKTNYLEKCDFFSKLRQSVKDGNYDVESFNPETGEIVFASEKVAEAFCDFAQDDIEDKQYYGRGHSQRAIMPLTQSDDNKKKVIINTAFKDPGGNVLTYLNRHRSPFFGHTTAHSSLDKGRDIAEIPQFAGPIEQFQMLVSSMRELEIGQMAVAAVAGITASPAGTGAGAVAGTGASTAQPSTPSSTPTTPARTGTIGGAEAGGGLTRSEGTPGSSSSLALSSVSSVTSITRAQTSTQLTKLARTGINAIVNGIRSISIGGRS